MLMRNFFQTLAMFYQNPYINPNKAVMKHALWQFRKVTNNFPCVFDFKDFKIMVKNRLVADSAGCLLNAMGYYDPNNMHFIEELLKKKICSVFFDVGSYIGMYSLIASCCPGAGVYSFEPHPFTFNILLENISLNNFKDKIRPFQLALSDSNGSAFFSNGKGVSTNKIEDKVSNGFNVIQVDAVTGDSFCEKHKVAPEFIKIDVEGHEDKVLYGFQNNMDDIKIIMVESKKAGKIRDILNQRHRFWGPYKLDYKNRTFLKDLNSYEDWIFINDKFKGILEGNNFHLPVSG